MAAALWRLWSMLIQMGHDAVIADNLAPRPWLQRAIYSNNVRESLESKLVTYVVNCLSLLVSAAHGGLQRSRNFPSIVRAGVVPRSRACCTACFRDAASECSQDVRYVDSQGER